MGGDEYCGQWINDEKADHAGAERYTPSKRFRRY
jgi:hypothetical protein